MANRGVFMGMAAGLIMLWAAAAAGASSQDLSVQVRSTKLRRAPQSWAPVISAVSYGDRVTVVPGEEHPGGWLKVRAGSKEGFLHISALSSRRIVVHGTGEAVGRSADTADVVLAGKGFNREIEAEYALTHALSYAGVDQLERERISDGQMVAFIKAGKLAVR